MYDGWRKIDVVLNFIFELVLMLLYKSSMRRMCILFDDQRVKWNTCEYYVVINQLKLCGCEWYKYRIDVNGVNIEQM